MQSVAVGWINYRHCVMVGAGVDSLYLAVFPAFRFWHPALEIPYADMHGVEVDGLLGFNTATLTFDQGVGMDVVLSKYRADRLELASGSTWHYNHAGSVA